jgi:hypothetical protein
MTKGLRRVGRQALRAIGRGPRPVVPPLATNTLIAPGNQWYAAAVAGASTFATVSTFADAELGFGVALAIRHE